ncbi:hypothetical protein SADUNF_Sadunf02G0192100 [Salix dunnii]|uniref:Uncharacterized protein n=1 Tax=Salix dunnii TaxID=1413687 RepID=A0A835N8T3_9ROSI|nr:hypothetical protein SADUNF_Sadunf02G0192100 [Salix dunnii]
MRIVEEDGVLKLVHPGRFVEIHVQPIAAAQVLENNPRHSITRPDVFEYPWIVIKPDSVLRLGKVFFIVPNSTIYNLLKAHKQCHQNSPRQSQFSKNCASGQVQKRNSTRKPAALTAKHRNKNRWFKQSLPITSCMGTAFQEHDCDKRIRNPPGKSVGMSPNQHQSLPITSWIVKSFQEQDCDKNGTKPAKAESWPKFVSKYRNTHLNFEEKPQEDSTSEIRPSDHEEYRFIKTSTTAGFPRKNDIELDYNCMEEVITLKPCLRKQDSARKLLQLKVSFILPDKDEEQRRAVHTKRAEVSSNCSCSSSEIFVHFTNLVSA